MGGKLIKDVNLDDLARELEENASSRVTHPSDKEALVLVEKFRNGDRQALHDLVERNERLVISAADKYTSDPELLKDLVQEGRMGLVRAVEKFDPKLGVKLSTYAMTWIRGNIEAYISKTTYNMKVPQNSRKLARRIFKACDRYAMEGADSAQISSLVAEELGVDVEVVNRLKAIRYANMSINDQVSHTTEGGITHQDLIETEERVEELAERESQERAVLRILDRLPEKQRIAVYFHYGLKGYPECSSFTEIGERMGVTRQYAQILVRDAKKALAQMSADNPEVREAAIA